MTLIVKITKDEVALNLIQKGQMLDLKQTKYYHDLSEVLITALDRLARRTKISPTALKTFELHSDLGSDSTSYKIAAAFIEALKVNGGRVRS